MSQKIDRNQNTLGSATINPCHPDISLMTEPERGGVVDESTIQDQVYISSVINFFYEYYKQFNE